MVPSDVTPSDTADTVAGRPPHARRTRHVTDATTASLQVTHRLQRRNRALDAVSVGVAQRLGVDTAEATARALRPIGRCVAGIHG
ncbi:hypothetical protein VB779_21020 [Haloarculaceae archaeon H-GB11]|nr:hypothetical protein [Haloarculaceae archaeon H-GB11]